MSRPMRIDPQAAIQPPRRSYADIDRDEIVRQALEEVASRIDKLHGNTVYQTAWRKASAVIRASKP